MMTLHGANGKGHNTVMTARMDQGREGHQRLSRRGKFVGARTFFWPYFIFEEKLDTSRVCDRRHVAMYLHPFLLCVSCYFRTRLRSFHLLYQFSLLTLFSDLKDWTRLRSCKCKMLVTENGELEEDKRRKYNDLLWLCNNTTVLREKSKQARKQLTGKPYNI